jgi:hypothetical protein
VVVVGGGNREFQKSHPVLADAMGLRDFHLVWLCSHS